jgi:hypothetical protein
MIRIPRMTEDHLHPEEIEITVPDGNFTAVRFVKSVSVK